MTTKPTRDVLANLICKTLAKRLKKPVEDITLQTRFDALQMDSLDLAELFFLLEEDLKMTLPLEQGVKLESINDVLDLMMNSLQTSSLTSND